MDVPAACSAVAPWCEAVGGHCSAEAGAAGWLASCFVAHADVACVEVTRGVAAVESGEGVGYVLGVDGGAVAGAADWVDGKWHVTMLHGVALVTVVSDGRKGLSPFVTRLSCENDSDSRNRPGYLWGDAYSVTGSFSPERYLEEKRTDVPSLQQLRGCVTVLFRLSSQAGHRHCYLLCCGCVLDVAVSCGRVYGW